MTANLFRTATLEVTADKATDSVCVATEAQAVPRDIRGQRIREHIDLAASDLSVLNNRGPLLFDHDPGREAGECVPGTFRVDPGQKLRGDIRWYPEFREVRTELLDGKRPNYFSVGYDWTRETHREQRGDGLHVWFAVKFFEVSNLSPGHLPADQNAGLYRSKNMNASLDKLLQLALSGSRQTEDDFSGASLAEVLDFKTPPRGLCRQLQDAAPAGCGGDVITGRWLSFDALAPHRRDLTVGGTGGNLVQQDMTGILGVLKNRCAAVDLGATVISGLQGDFVLPLATTSALTVESLSEIQQASVSDLTTAQRIGRPHRCTIQIKVSKQLLLQSPATEPFLRSEFLAQFAVAVDRLVFFGGQNPAEPIGILNTPGVASEVFGGPPTWPAVLKFEKALSDANADIGSLGWALAPATRNAWKQVSRSGSYPSFIMENDKVNSYPTSVTNTLAAANQAVFGNWSDLLILVWGNGAEIIRDPFTHAGSAETVFTANLWLDVMLRRPQSFVVSADSANQ